MIDIEILKLHIQRILENNKYNSSFNKAKKIANSKRCNLIDVNLEKGIARFKVVGGTGGRYEVVIEDLNEKELLVLCDCPYNWNDLCKHSIAAFIELERYLQTLEKRETVYFNMMDSKVFLPFLEENRLKAATSEENFRKASVFESVEIVSALNGIANSIVRVGDNIIIQRFEQLSSDKKFIVTSCSCKQTLINPLCEHKVAALKAIQVKFGVNAFEMMKDWDAEKNKALGEYGFSLKDDLIGKFDFKFNQARLELVVLDKSIHPIQKKGTWVNLQKNLGKPNVDDSIQIHSFDKKQLENNRVKELFFNFQIQKDKLYLPDTILVPMIGHINHKTGKVTNKALLGNIEIDDLPAIDAEDSKVIKQSKLFGISKIIQLFRKNGFDAPSYYSEYFPRANVNDLAFQVLQEYIGNVIESIYPILLRKKVTIGFRSSNALQPVELSQDLVKPIFQLREDDLFFILDVSITLNKDTVPLENFQKLGFWLLEYKNKLYKIKDITDANALEYFSEVGSIKVKKDNFSSFYSDFVEPLAENFEIDIAIDRPVKYIPLEWSGSKVFFKEDENNLILVPTFNYLNQNENIEYLFDGKSSQLKDEEGTLQFLQRSPDFEQEIYDFMVSLHPDFEFQNGKHFFYIPFENILKNNWFFEVFEKLKEKNIPVFGQNNLKKIRYNPNKAYMQLKVSSGIDWFDLKMEISFGDQFIDLSSIRKAILKKQNYVELKDGTLGVLPDEWLEKYASIFKFGNLEGDELKVSKLHFSIIDELYAEIDNAEVQKELEEKKQKLLNFKEIKNVALPKNVKATLRDYQAEGFNWLNFLDEFRFGGCLADDMGLGKTLQALTFLQDQKNKFPKSTNLIVMPTTLIFNWLAEAEKFCPKLKIFVYRGSSREKDTTHFKKYDLILTTYGTLRSDIVIFKSFVFHYIILDESQAIKNPNAQISKAVKLLQAITDL